MLLDRPREHTIVIVIVCVCHQPRRGERTVCMYWYVGWLSLDTNKTTTVPHYLSHELIRGRMLHKLKLNSKTCDLSECIYIVPWWIDNTKYAVFEHMRILWTPAWEWKLKHPHRTNPQWIFIKSHARAITPHPPTPPPPPTDPPLNLERNVPQISCPCRLSEEMGTLRYRSWPAGKLRENCPLFWHWKNLHRTSQETCTLTLQEHPVSYPLWKDIIPEKSTQKQVQVYRNAQNSYVPIQTNRHFLFENILSTYIH